MSKISDKLNIISSAKNDIKTAIENKGVSVGDIGIQEYASKIDEMQVATPPAKGFIVNEFDSNGYATDVSVVGMNTIPAYYLYYACYANGSNKGWLSSIGANLHLPNSITSIDAYAFGNCTNLLLTSLPDSITSIGAYAFQKCTNLPLTSLPRNLTTIGNYGFSECTYLALTELPENLTTIGTYAFYKCRNLKLTSLPKGITTIYQYVFRECTNLALTELPENLTTIGTYAFYQCTNLKLTSIPSGVTSINNYTFYYCTSLNDMTINGVITSIGTYAFNNCNKLAKVVIPNVTSVPTLSNVNAFTSTPIASGEGYIYVPDDLVASFQSASNWSTYASQIKGVSEL